ncbi:MAG: 2Fe-2S iron-sulfur cluster-binding protein, partial [Tenuifilaceae bacterium]|nr:2Fe-2S iron-sulfur cluster-binding protein [Tenuifilaceae bacterium]
MILLLSNLVVILSAILVFLAVVSILVGVLLFAKKKLTPQGEVTLTINDDKEIVVEPGSTILSTLSNNGVFLPSACGGGGTCGMCKCQVFEGGGSILATEVDFFTRRQQAENWRLGCQVKIKEDIKIG